MFIAISSAGKAVNSATSRREVHKASRLDIKVWHKSQTKKSRRKRYLIGSAYVTIGELQRGEGKPGASELSGFDYAVASVWLAEG